MDGAGAHPGGGIAPAHQSRGWLGWLLPPATALVIIVASVLLLTSPIWMHNALRATSANSWVSPDETYFFSDPTVESLLFGGDFDVKVGPGVNFYTPAEQSHLQDARTLLYVFVGLAALSLVLIVAALIHSPRDARRWRSVARGGLGLAVGAVVIGVVGAFAFDQLFVLFHEIFFPQGNWEFPANSNMIQLYPDAFWQLTSAALGVLCVVFGLLVWFVARRRARTLA